MNASTGFNCLVQFDFFLKRPSSKTTDSIVVGDKIVPLLFVINPRSKRYLLRLRPDGTARVTIPRRGSIRAAREFAGRNVAWLSQQLQRLAAKPVRNKAWNIGSEIFFRGETVKIVAGVESAFATFAEQTIRMTGTGDDLRPKIEQHMRMVAATELPPKTIHFAQRHGLTVQRVTVRNQKSRWGSCSRRGTISLNWRLIQAPAFVADYIILHELMHLRQMNHSRRFWQEVEHVCPDFREAEKWLKKHSSLLR